MGISIKKIESGNISLVYIEGKNAVGEACSLVEIQGLIKMVFILKGHFTDNNKKKYPEFSHNFESYKFASKNNVIVSNSSEIEVAILYFPKTILQSIASTPFILEKLENVKNQSSFKLFDAFATMSAEIQTIIYEMVHCNRLEWAKELFFKAKTLKLILLQFEQYQYLIENNNLQTIKSTDQSKLYEAKKYLDLNFQEDTTILKLAKYCGINDFTLKKGFKLMFGYTIQGYLNELRMNHAKTLLISTDKSLTEIAEDCHYQYAQNFSKAFKNKFGVLPSNFRKKQMQ